MKTISLFFTHNASCCLRRKQLPLFKQKNIPAKLNQVVIVLISFIYSKSTEQTEEIEKPFLRHSFVFYFIIRLINIRKTQFTRSDRVLGG